MVELLYAMGEAPAGAEQAGSVWGSLIPIILIFGVFYFLLIRPQKKQMEKHSEMVDNIQKGDKIVTSGGIHGKVTALKGKQIEVEIASNTRVLINKQSVSSVIDNTKQAEVVEE
ncbi:MAG: preprotein translocase subunit YajC [Elusimicrobiota bacterium]